jgi:hypothetical protein
MIGERRRQALNGDGDLLGRAVRPERDIRRLFSKTHLEETPAPAARLETCPTPWCARAREGERIHMNARLASRPAARPSARLRGYRSGNSNISAKKAHISAQDRVSALAS